MSDGFGITEFNLTLQQIYDGHMMAALIVNSDGNFEKLAVRAVKASNALIKEQKRNNLCPTKTTNTD